MEPEAQSSHHFQSRPPYMTEIHELLLKQFWSEGMTPTPMQEELLSVCPDLTAEQCRAIVSYWMWSDRFNVRR